MPEFKADPPLPTTAIPELQDEAALTDLEYRAAVEVADAVNGIMARLLKPHDGPSLRWLIEITAMMMAEAKWLTADAEAKHGGDAKTLNDLLGYSPNWCAIQRIIMDRADEIDRQGHA